ncbi:MAG: hypothetical protein COA79_08645 [Planctomycetota bacterium]|nr:MAG: hypothetical protein COA79_08645 [Planctomycetota bacterium]
MSRLRKAFTLEESKGDMTTMIDVVFLLLIFFIVMPFKTPEARIEAHLPKTSGPPIINPPPPPDIEKIDIKINRNGMPINPATFQGIDIKLNGHKIAFMELRAHLNRLKNKIKVDQHKVPVELNADEDVPFVFVMNALDSAKLNGFTFIKFPEVPVLPFGQRPRHH